MKNLSSPPLVYVCGKIEFATLPTSHIEETINALHEEIRNDYPDFQKGEGKRVNVNVKHGADLKSDATIIEEKLYQWFLRDKSGAWELRIDSGSVFIQTSAYSGFNDLKERLLGILEALNKRMSVNHTRSIGMRYINIVPLNPEADAFPDVENGFLQPELPYFKAKGGSSMTSLYQAPTDNWVQLKTNVLINKSWIPDQLLEAAQRIGLGGITNGVFASIDIDSFQSSKEYSDYSLPYIDGELQKLHASIEKTFKSVFTADAIKSWE